MLGVWDKNCLLVCDISTFSKCRKMVFIPNTPTKGAKVQPSLSRFLDHPHLLVWDQFFVNICWSHFVCAVKFGLLIFIFLLYQLSIIYYPYNLALSPRVRIIEVWLYFCCTDMLFLRYLIMGTVLRYSCALDKF